MQAPIADLASRIGRLLTAFFGQGGFTNVTVRASGHQAPRLLETVKRLASVELLRPALEGPVNVINVEAIAAERGIELVPILEPAPPAGLVGGVIGVRVSNGEEGPSHRVLGTAYVDGLPRVLRIDDFAMDLVPEGEIVLIENEDEPGVIGTVGNTFGDAGINIADMVISRMSRPDGQRVALMVVKVDSSPTPALLRQLKSRPNIRRVMHASLPPIER